MTASAQVKLERNRARVGRPRRICSRATLTVCLLILGACASPPAATRSAATAPSAAPTIRPTTTPASSSTSAAAISGLFDIGGRSLFLECRGTGSPTVIFLAGTDVPRTAMRGIADRLLEGPVRVCDYDRANEGQSDPAPARQTDEDVVDDLAALLKAAAIEPPYVLVGQSVGGDQAWLYASRHPTGLGGFLMMNAGPFLLAWDDLKDVLTDQEIADERAVSEAVLGAVKQAATPPAGVPYVVMMSTVSQCASPTDVCGRIYPFYEAWADELAGRTPDGRIVRVDAGHEIYKDQPDSVIDEIGRLLADVH
jgi:hypothetical protein